MQDLILIAVLILIIIFFLYEPLGLKEFNPFAGEKITTGYPRERCPRGTTWNPEHGDCVVTAPTQMISPGQSMMAEYGPIYGY